MSNKNNTDTLLTLNLDSSPLVDSVRASSFISTVTPIILETTNDNLIGLLCAMQVTTNCICILDDGHRGSGNLFVFDKQGKYLRKIGHRGNGPGEYLNIQDFTINEKEDIVFLVDNEAEKIRIYQFSTGKFLKNLDCKDKNISYGNIQYCNNKLYTDFTYYTKTEKGPMLYMLNETTGDIESKYLDIEIHNHGWLKSIFKGESFFYCKNSLQPKYTHYFMDTIMTIKNNQLEPYLVIKSNDWVTKKDVQNNKNTTPYMDNDAFFKIENLPIAFNVQNYMESKEYIYFLYTKQGKFIKVIYNKKTNNLQRTKRVIDDIMCNNTNSTFPLIGCNDENGMYGYINTVGVSSFYHYTVKDSASGLKPEYKELFEKNITPESNPIILYYEYKK